MRLSKVIGTGIAALAGLAMTAPASATIFEYVMVDGGRLNIDTDNQRGTWKNDDIDVSFTSPDFANFTGGENPNFSYILTSLDGTRQVNGMTLTDNPKNINTSHPQVLKGLGNNKFNLWAWWGDPIKAGDYVRKSTGVTSHPTPVPAPGMMALFGLALGGIAFGRRRRKTAA